LRRLLDRYHVLVRPGTAWRWWLVVALALLVSGLEALGAVLVYALTGLASEPGGTIELPLLGDLRDQVPGWENDQLVVATAIGVAIFFVVRGLAVLLQTYTQVRVANAAAVDLATQLLDRYLRVPYDFHLQRNSSELIRNTTESVTEILNTVLVPAVRLFAESVLVLVLTGVLIATAPREALLAVAVLGPVVFIVLRLVQPRIARLGAIKQRESAVSIQLLQDSLHGYRDVTLLDRREHFTDAYRASRLTVTRTGYLRAALSARPKAIIEAIVVSLIAAFLAVSVRRGDATQSLAVVGLFGYAALRLMPALEKLVKNLNDLRFGRAALDDVTADLAIATRDGVRSAAALPFTRALTLDRVTFTHPGNTTPTLEAIDLSVGCGTSLGIVGATGAGKSTLVDVMVGLATPTAGLVHIDDVDLRGHEAAWQRNIGLVSQEVFLLDDTLRRNIALGVPDGDIDEAAVLEAVELAQLRDLLNSLPDGLASRVGERGMRVSGGQRQRIAIARALYPRPQVLVFDEGTAALDNATEAEVTAALARLQENHTIITIAHRLTTVRDHDRIVHLDEGRVSALGTYEELLRDSPGFRQLARVQDHP
jgi:ATP-binding cassette, subfamily B, bacterial PglK